MTSAQNFHVVIGLPQRHGWYARWQYLIAVDFHISMLTFCPNAKGMRFASVLERQESWRIIMDHLMAIKRLAILSLVCAAIAHPAVAQTESDATRDIMSIGQIVTFLRERGYSHIDDIEREPGNRYEIEATDPDGVRVELYLDGRTGKILYSKRDD